MFYSFQMHIVVGKLLINTPLFSSSSKTLVAATIRMASSLYKDKAYVNGEWVSASSGATFEGTLKCIVIFLNFHTP